MVFPHLIKQMDSWSLGARFFIIVFPDFPGSPVHEIFDMLLAVFDRAALMLICLFFLIRIRLFRELLHKSAHSPKELLAVTAIFSMFALFSTWSGVPVEGSLVNVRIIAVMSGGILFGPWVGIITGLIAGTHRYLIDIGGVTAIPCFITSIIAGVLSGCINRKIKTALARGDHRRYGV
jgi:two-component system LytT family sensor kinase